MIIIGSEAIKYWYSDFKREPNDIDIVCEPNEKVDLLCNYKRIERSYNPILLKYASPYSRYLKPDLLATLKASHLCWDIFWEKNMWDLQFLLTKGAKIDYKVFDELYVYWNDFHGKNKRSDLKMSKEDFFTNAINYDEHEHDELHKLINPIPTYTLVLKDWCEVELDENKFHNLTHEQKLDFVREEVMIMAYERYSKLYYKQAYRRMLKKFIISHAPYFALTFILENYLELGNINFNFINKISDELQRTK